MFNRKFRLMIQAVGLVAMLVLILVLPGVTQDDPFARANIVKMLQNRFTVLVAAAGDLLDFESAVFWSDGGPRLIAYIPPHPASEFFPRLRQLLAGEEVEVPLGGIYMAEDARGILPAGTFMIRLKGEKAVFIDSEGEEVAAFQAKVNKDKQIFDGRIPFRLIIARLPISQASSGETSIANFSTTSQPWCGGVDLLDVIWIPFCPDCFPICWPW